MKFAESHRRIFSTQVVSAVLDQSIGAYEKVDLNLPGGEYIPLQLRDKVEGVDYFLPKIDLRNWKPVLPISKPTELKPPTILDYATNETPQNFMNYNSTNGRLEVILNEDSSHVYADIHMQKEGRFENYFKAGNYLLTRDRETCACVKYYDLIVSH